MPQTTLPTSNQRDMRTCRSYFGSCKARSPPRSVFSLPAGTDPAVVAAAAAAAAASRAVAGAYARSGDFSFGSSRRAFEVATRGEDRRGSGAGCHAETRVLSELCLGVGRGAPSAPLAHRAPRQSSRRPSRQARRVAPSCSWSVGPSPPPEGRAGTRGVSARARRAEPRSVRRRACRTSRASRAGWKTRGEDLPEHHRASAK